MAATTSESAIPQVLAEIKSGDKLTFQSASKLLGSDPVTAWRNATRGAKTPTGEIIKLEAVRVGARWLTSEAAVNRFVLALTAAFSPPPPKQPKPKRSPSAREKAAEAAAARLEAAGA